MSWFLHRRIKDLSGGQKKLLSVAQALITEPGIILLDEPTSGLDAMTAETLMLALSNVVSKTKCCMVVVIHQPSGLVYSLFDDLVLLCRGKVIYSGPRERADKALDALDRKLQRRHEHRRKGSKTSSAQQNKIMGLRSTSKEQGSRVGSKASSAAGRPGVSSKDAPAPVSSDATLARAMNMFQSPERKWDMLRHALFVPRAPSAADFIGAELADVKKDISSIKRAIDGADPAPGKAALLIEVFAYNQLSVVQNLPLLLMPLGAVVVWGFLESSSAKHDAAKCMLEVYVVGFAVINILLPTVFSHLHTNKDCLQDRIFRGPDMFWVLILFSQLLSVLIALMMGSLSVPAYSLPADTMRNCGVIEHVAVCYLYATFISLLLNTLMFRARGHEDSARMAAVFTQLAVVTAALSLFSGFTITLSESAWLQTLLMLSPPFWAQKKLVVAGFLNESYGCIGTDCLLNSGNAWIAMLYGAPDSEWSYFFLCVFSVVTLVLARLMWLWKMGAPAVKALVPLGPDKPASSVALFPAVATSSFAGLLDRIMIAVARQDEADIAT
ncbi:unnamed protein product [Amoebophrya sp. A25]|nr:unnamed protein product [Amoebophrya sp. A25]|eukprot:GSA25T00009977001.1